MIICVFTSLVLYFHIISKHGGNSVPLSFTPFALLRGKLARLTGRANQPKHTCLPVSIETGELAA